MSDLARWYVVHTYSGYENKVATNLEKIVENRKLHDWIHEIRVPTETVVEIKDNKKREVERKIFPGYVLVKMVMTDDSWYVVRNTRGCTGFVGPNGKPIPLTEEEVAGAGRREAGDRDHLCRGRYRAYHRRPAGEFLRHCGRNRSREKQSPRDHFHVRAGNPRGIGTGSSGTHGLMTAGNPLAVG